jgi:hypothetical protein
MAIPQNHANQGITISPKNESKTQGINRKNLRFLKYQILQSVKNTNSINSMGVVHGGLALVAHERSPASRELDQTLSSWCFQLSPSNSDTNLVNTLSGKAQLLEH